VNAWISGDSAAGSTNDLLSGEFSSAVDLFSEHAMELMTITATKPMKAPNRGCLTVIPECITHLLFLVV
jgi:hypothetical protein